MKNHHVMNFECKMFFDCYNIIWNSGYKAIAWGPSLFFIKEEEYGKIVRDTSTYASYWNSKERGSVWDFLMA